ncbi:MAG: pyruvate, phosphate dikinase/phosphoenolpyruvate synthase regulator [Thiotrichaceae bacterium]|nr:pyruvate, phosphate dikinase/phosphoenolpyruvate synthase regulator [Thiotrichaceae bacterium]
MPTDNKQKRIVYFISDRTSLTAETYGRSLLAQFPHQHFKYKRLSFVDTKAQALTACDIINNTVTQTGCQAIVFSTLVDPDIQTIIEQSNAYVIGLINTFIGPLESFLGEESAHTLGGSHQIFKNTDYQKRLDAIDYAMSCDDGVRPDRYDEAEVILTGVSRSGKTPVSLSLAISFAVKVANYPITEHELKSERLPECLLKHKDRLIGLTIKPRQLSSIRLNRRTSREYSSLAVCQQEVKAVESMFTYDRIPFFDSTESSIEELAGHVMKILGLNRV